MQSILDQFQTCVKCEEADINSEIACRNEKIARIEADILRVEQAISKSETALQQVHYMLCICSSRVFLICFSNESISSACNTAQRTQRQDFYDTCQCEARV